METPVPNLSLSSSSPKRIDWIDSLRVIFMYAVIMRHFNCGPYLGLYSLTATHGYLLLAGYLFAYRKTHVSLFSVKKATQLLVIYIFWCFAVRFFGELLTHVSCVMKGIQNRPFSLTCPSLKDFVLPFSAPYLCHLWWLKTYLILTCLAGFLYRIPAPFLLVLSLVCMGANYVFQCYEPVFLRPSAVGFYLLGVCLSRIPHTQIEFLTGKNLPKPILWGCIFIPAMILLPFMLGLIKYPMLENHCIFLVAFFLILAMCSHGIAKVCPRIQKCFSALVPSLMIFYIIHPLFLQIFNTFNYITFKVYPPAYAKPLYALLTFVICYAIYRLASRYSPLMCYLFLCKPDKPRG